MARQLTGKQQAFLNVLLKEAGGNMVSSKETGWLFRHYNVPQKLSKV